MAKQCGSITRCVWPLFHLEPLPYERKGPGGHLRPPLRCLPVAEIFLRFRLLLWLSVSSCMNKLMLQDTVGGDKGWHVLCSVGAPFSATHALLLSFKTLL